MTPEELKARRDEAAKTIMQYVTSTLDICDQEQEINMTCFMFGLLNGQVMQKLKAGGDTSKEVLLKSLGEIAKIGGDQEAAHLAADRALIQYINDPEVKKAYEKIPKWYA